MITLSSQSYKYKIFGEVIDFQKKLFDIYSVIGRYNRSTSSAPVTFFPSNPSSINWLILGSDWFNKIYQDKSQLVLE